jgi:hypothetical protein
MSVKRKIKCTDKKQRYRPGKHFQTTIKMTIENKFGGISKPYLLSVTAMTIVLPAVAFIAEQFISFISSKLFEEASVVDYAVVGVQ